VGNSVVSFQTGPREQEQPELARRTDQQRQVLRELEPRMDPQPREPVAEDQEAPEPRGLEPLAWAPPRHL
jgi:hypothetical protein